MKRILLAGALAVAIHGYLLGGEPEWLNRRPPDKPKPPVITMSLSYRLPPRPEPTPPAITPEIASYKSVPSPKKEKPKPAARPRPSIEVKREPKKVPILKRKIVKPSRKVSRSEERGPEPALESEGPEVTEGLSDPRPNIPDDIPEEPRLEEKGEIASLPPGRSIRKARPAYKVNPAPEYPRLARRRGYQGTAILEVLVDREGGVGEIRVATSSGYGILDRAAVASVKRWLFEPGMRGDERAEMWVRVPVRFQLK